MEKRVLGTDSICWNITNRCNMLCDFCFRDIFGSDLSIEENKKILTVLKEKGIKKITFAGGEALLYHKFDKGFLEILKEAYNMGFECRLITNGTNFQESANFKEADIFDQLSPDYYLDEVLPYLSRITFSCDRVNKYENDDIGRRLVGDKEYDPTKAIFYLVEEIRKKYSKENLEIDINTVALRDINGNYYYLDDMQELVYTHRNLINKWKILIFYGLRGEALDKKDLYKVPDEDIDDIKKAYVMETDDLSVSVKDNDDMDTNLILSNDGILKRSLNGKEYILCDLKEEKNNNDKNITFNNAIIDNYKHQKSKECRVVRSKNASKVLDTKRKLFNRLNRNRGENDV